MKDSNMKKEADKEPEMRSEYDFSGGVRGKYAQRYARGTNMVLLDPDVAEVFTDTRLLNQLLRTVAKILSSQTDAKAGMKE